MSSDRNRTSDRRSASVKQKQTDAYRSRVNEHFHEDRQRRLQAMISYYENSYGQGLNDAGNLNAIDDAFNRQWNLTSFAFEMECDSATVQGGIQCKKDVQTFREIDEIVKEHSPISSDVLETMSALSVEQFESNVEKLVESKEELTTRIDVLLKPECETSSIRVGSDGDPEPINGFDQLVICVPPGCEQQLIVGETVAPYVYHDDNEPVPARAVIVTSDPAKMCRRHSILIVPRPSRISRYSGKSIIESEKWFKYAVDMAVLSRSRVVITTDYFRNIVRLWAPSEYERLRLRARSTTTTVGRLMNGRRKPKCCEVS